MSFFYKLDARSKFAFVFLLTILVFLVDKFPAAVFLLIFSVIVRLSAKIPSPGIKSFKYLALLAVFIILIQTFFGPGQSYILNFGDIISLKREGFFLGLVIVCRLASLVILLPVFTETTPPARIAGGLHSLGLNYRTAFIITFSFNLIPCFKEEAHSIMEAQKLRGLRSFGIASYAALMVPLMLSAMRKAQVSSVAMDCRAFGIYKTRTWTDLQRMTRSDFLFIMTCIVFFACMMFFNYF